MAKTGVDKFRFVSPGVQIAEIDNSQLPQIPENIGPVIIGTAQQGPGLRPVKVSSFSEFVEIFGSPEAGNKGGDIWRDGGYGVAPTYGAYAAQAWLKNNNPITYVRLLGRASDDATAAGEAGWQVGNSPVANSYASGAAYGLFLINSGTAQTGTLAATFYCQDGAVGLSGTVAGGVTTTGSTNHLIESVGANLEFNAVIRDSSGAVTDTLTFNFGENSKNYIRKVFNTNPTLVDNTREYASGSVKNYFLGETFDRDIDERITNNGTGGNVYGAILPLHNDSTDVNLNRASLTKAETGWVIGQDLGGVPGDYSPRNMQKLFKFKALEGGQWNQANIKISIRDVRPSANDIEKYGSFTVEIRDAKDTDNAAQPLESFTNCTLNPYSRNYIAEKIGNSYAEWSDTDRRFREYGDFQNRSKYIYVDMDPDVHGGATDPELLPFGYFGPLRYKGFSVSGSDQTVPTAFGDDTTAFAEAMVRPMDAGYGGNASNALIQFDGTFTGSFAFPKTRLRRSTETGDLASPKDAYFGLDTTKSGSSNRFENSYVDVVRGLNDNLIGTFDDENGYTEFSYVFSLDDITRHSGSSPSASDDPSTTQAFYLSGSRASSLSLTATGSGATYKEVLDAGFDQFTMPIVGGFDGLDITERNPFNNYVLGGTNTSTITEFNSYAFNSVKCAIDAVSDPEVIDCNMLIAPGIWTEGLTNQMLKVCESRGDAMAIIDIEGNYLPREDRASYVTSDSDSNVIGNVQTAVDTLNNRQINNSYGSAYYPWVRIKDDNSGLSLWAPPSIAAFGTYSSTEANSELWFAPAGFTRGGLTEGAAGIPVLGVKQRLTSKDRDKLYEANINPIAQFPAEGIVIFGQKTLQITPSALDRVNVRRMLIFVKKEISRISSRLLFDQNVESTWDRFTGQVVPFLDSVKVRLGLEDYRVLLDRSTTTPDLIDRNTMYAKIFLKPAKAIEFIAIDFVITNSGASFED
jgi:hypothetical protein